MTFENFYLLQSWRPAIWRSAAPGKFFQTSARHSICQTQSAQEWENRTLAVHERVDSRNLVLAGSESIFIEITEYEFMSLLQARAELQCK